MLFGVRVIVDNQTITYKVNWQVLSMFFLQEIGMAEKNKQMKFSVRTNFEHNTFLCILLRQLLLFYEHVIVG